MVTNAALKIKKNILMKLRPFPINNSHWPNKVSHYSIIVCLHTTIQCCEGNEKTTDVLIRIAWDPNPLCSHIYASLSLTTCDPALEAHQTEISFNL